MSLTHRDRVLTALNHEEPDRVPTAIWGGSYGIVNDVYLQLVDYFGFGAPAAPFRSGHSISYMDDRLLDALDTDIRYVYPAQMPNSPIETGDVVNPLKDSYGQVWHKAVPYFFSGIGILSGMEPGDNLDDFISFPDPSENKWMDGVAERARHLRENTDCFVSMRMVSSHGPFQTACDLRGVENFLIDMSLHEDFAIDLLNRIADLQCGLLEQAMKSGGEHLDMIELPGDDYASNKGLLFSPRMFRKLIKPIIARYVETIRAFRPDISIMLHSDGLITKLLDDFIEVGIDVVHPLEPLNGLNHEEIKADYGQKLSFLGAIDISHAMPGSRETVIEEARTRIQQLGSGGGYILAPSNHLQADVSPENIEALFKAANKYGQYPLYD